MIHSFGIVESTNETAKSTEFQNAPHGTVIIAEEQTAGKGRHGKSFLSPAGQIYMSAILQAESPELMTIFAAVCVCESIEDLTDKKPKIKWVNDIFLDNKKICGILSERNSAMPNRVIVGIGINFHGVQFPQDLPNAANLFTETPTITKDRLIIEIINKLVSVFNKEEIISQYKSRLIEGSDLIEIDEEIRKHS